MKKNKELLDEYSKAIVFDYSYKYFYEDGHGKDFYVYNHEKTKFTENYTNLILTANLLSFYEQMIIYQKHKEELRNYNIEKPLWAFIGSTVNAVYKEKGIVKSDIRDILIFLKNMIENKDFLNEILTKILKGETGLKKDGEDIFKNRYEYLKECGYKINDIYKKLFNANGGTLCVYELKSAEGELGLKVGDGEYFGVVNIGDVSSFKKLLVEKDVEVKSDNFTSSLFERVNEPNSNINVLIGAKKFIEGWNSWD